MRKLLIAGVAAAFLTGIAYTQAGQRPDENWAEIFTARTVVMRATSVEASATPRK